MSVASGRPAAPRAQYGCWQALRELGRGATTIVYQAAPAGCANNAADYALKVLAPAFVHDRAAIAALQREAFACRQVAHPHLMSVLAAQCDEPPYFVVSPLLTGVTLAQLAGGPRLPTPHALWIVRQAAEALAALHAADWLHLDVSPRNIMVASTGHATLIDLGFARRLSEARELPQQTLAGTPTCLPPEMVQRGGTITPAADVYSLGVVLYQLLIGTLPFADDDPLELVAAHQTMPAPSVRERLPHVPAQLARVVRRMLAKQPLRRPSAAELVELLAELEIRTFAERLVA